ncbi:trans-aconitate 2-methyltransferase [Kaistia dalseonensis]|uniref:Trans-aconitate 2-methyltransferase n=1 Tax=Kaistia dalseonensis TaxID=410840 RepID=A0ABU0HBW7_9HYPH|nr:trans-aconitate 2-methyltransferase [Kaistia dalseonensis]MCX5497177.1 trans-aconitate 2-methyltransferase [Kaistia dalseonensis]MDQ0439808.1 trans-aconitate 2-methyltransferase [Kaistia dalseonensis]
MNATAWSASQYLKFEDERTRPARDLLAQVPLTAPKTVIDLGCGPGNSTELLAARWPAAELTGLDSDPDMLETARKRLPDHRFIAADLANWMPEAPVDVLFANAVFQWIPNHLEVLVRLLGTLSSGGALAVQMPDNLGEPTHLLMEEVAHSGPWASAFAGQSLRRRALPAPSAYFDALHAASARVDVWHTVYNHPLADAAAIVEWVKGTGLRPYLDRVPTHLRAEFLAAYTARIAATYPPMADGRVLLRFPRIFVLAVRA